MANLKEIRNRISSVESTMKITQAMKMVSTAKLKKAQDAITTMRPYSSKLTELLQNLSGAIEGNVGGAYAEQRELKKVLLVPITSNRGLCGGFNSSIIKAVNKVAFEKYSDATVDLLTIGKKGNAILSKDFKVIDDQSALFDELTFENVALLAEKVMEIFANKQYDKIELVYNQFINAGTQLVKVEQFLPIQPVEATENVDVDYIYEPSKAEILLELIPKSLKTQLYKAIRDSFASEHGARMTAMHKATDNATALRDELKITYNKARQEAITNEILEIVGGAEALNN